MSPPSSKRKRDLSPTGNGASDESSEVTLAGKTWEVYNAAGHRRIIVTKVMPGTRWLFHLIREGFRVDVCQSNDILTKTELLAAVTAAEGGCQAAIGQLTEKWDQDLFAELKRQGCKVYSNMAVGIDNVDTESATANGIPVGNTPGVLTETTAESAIALTFAAARWVVPADRFTRNGHFKGWLPNMFVGELLYGKTVGIVGAGRIGSAYARMLMEGHKMNVLYYDLVQNTWLESYAASYSEFLSSQNSRSRISCRRVTRMEDLFADADVISVHCALTPNTRGIIGKEQFGAMKPNAIFINTSRGPVVNEADLLAHCQQHPAFCAGLDVYEKEPSVLQGLEAQDNVVLLPHIGSATLWTRSGMATLAACNCVGVLNGSPAWNDDNMLPFVDGVGQVAVTEKGGKSANHDWHPPAAIPSVVNRAALKKKNADVATTCQF